MPHTRDDLVHLGVEVLAAVLSHRGPVREAPAVIAAWLDERLARATEGDLRPLAIEVVDARGWQAAGGGRN